MATTDLPVIEFKKIKDWEKWLAKNHEKTQGIFIRFFKKNSGVTAITYNEALDVALCYGWIDSLVKKYDEKSYIQKFTPRRSKSVWSEINRKHIQRLIKEGRMKPAGIKQVTDAKKDGRWENAYGSPKTIKIPEDFLKTLKKNPKADEFFKTLNKTNTYAIAWNLHTAKKPETRERRMKKFIEMLSREEKLY